MGDDVAKTLRFIFAQSLDWADDNGWTDDACQNDRIVDWFGPGDFMAIKELVERLEEALAPPSHSAEIEAAREAERDLCNSIVRKAWGDNISIDAMAEIEALRVENGKFLKALQRILDIANDRSEPVIYRVDDIRDEAQDALAALQQQGEGK